MSNLQPVFSVHEFNEAMNHLVSQVGSVTVEGEISQLKVSQNKWVFLNLKDQQASVGVFATVWQIKNLYQLEDGMLVKVTGTPGIYGKTGSFRLTAQQIIPSGEGAIKLAYEKLRLQLEQEGLFAPERKRPLPRFPKTIGLITAKDSQAYNDFIKVSKHRFGGVKIVFYPVQVQGNEATKSILKAIQYFHKREPVDLLVLTRGGGSLEDLMAFNDELVVRTVFASKIPVVCAIGHEGDVSLAELAADLRASTPSNAAELIMPDRESLQRELNHKLRQVQTYLDYSFTSLDEKSTYLLQQVVSQQQSILSSMQHMLVKAKFSIRSVKQVTGMQAKKIDSHLFLIQKHFTNYQASNRKLQLQVRNVLLQTNNSITSLQSKSWNTLTTLAVQLQLVLPFWIESQKKECNHLLSLINSYDYQQVINRGFSLTVNQSGEIIRSVKDLSLKDSIKTTVADGTIDSLVTKLK